jgi:hypothetical protein
MIVAAVAQHVLGEGCCSKGRKPETVKLTAEGPGSGGATVWFAPLDDPFLTDDVPQACADTMEMKRAKME